MIGRGRNGRTIVLYARIQAQETITIDPALVLGFRVVVACTHCAGSGHDPYNRIAECGSVAVCPVCSGTKTTGELITLSELRELLARTTDIGPIMKNIASPQTKPRFNILDREVDPTCGIGVPVTSDNRARWTKEMAEDMEAYHSKSDIEVLVEMFDRAGIGYNRGTAHISVEAGYAGFLSEFGFDPHGNLASVEAYE